MKDGLVQQVGAPLELYGRPANKFVAGFIGSPAMNFVDVAIQAGNGRLWAEAQGFRIRVPDRISSQAGKRVTLGVRPEAVRIANRWMITASPPGSTWSSRSATRSCSTSAPAACRWWPASILARA